MVEVMDGMEKFFKITSCISIILTMMIITFTNMVKEVVVMVVGEMQKFFKFASYISIHSDFNTDDDASVWLVLVY